MPVMRSVFYVPGNNESIYLEVADYRPTHYPRSGGFRPPSRKTESQRNVRENLKLRRLGRLTDLRSDQ